MSRIDDKWDYIEELIKIKEERIELKWKIIEEDEG